MKQRKQVEVFNSVRGAAFFEAMLHEWQVAGWRVTQIHSLDQGEYRSSRGLLGRLGVRWRMYGLYAWRCWRAAQRSQGRARLRVVTTNPFFAPALVQRTAGKTGATINLLYDLYPDALILAGAAKEESWLARRCAAATRYALRECAATVFLGLRLKQYAEAHYGRAQRGVVIPVGADGAPFRDFPPEPLGASAAVTVLYAGQMGRMHDTETVRKLLEREMPRGVELLFHATGAGFTTLKRSVPSVARCSWKGSVSNSEWQSVMTASQVALVTMAPGAEQIVMPSKTYSALVAGQAILAICASESDLADLVRKHDCGWVVEPGDVAGVHAVLESIVASPLMLQRKRLNAFQTGHRDYCTSVVAMQWQHMFNELSATPVNGSQL